MSTTPYDSTRPRLRAVEQDLAGLHSTVTALTAEVDGLDLVTVGDIDAKIATHAADPDAHGLPQVREDIDQLQANLDTAEGQIATKANYSTLTAHTSNTSNPHSVTKAQVGLGNVPNTDATARANHTGIQSADTLTDGTTNKVFTVTEKTKLSGIATGATANAADSYLLNRANHTGAQAISTVTGLQTALDAKASTASLAAYLPRDGSGAMSGDLELSGQNINSANRINAASIALINGALPAVLMTEVDGALVEFGSNFTQSGVRNDEFRGSFFRIDTRDDYTDQLFSVFHQPPGTTEIDDEVNVFKVSTDGDVVAASFAGDGSGITGLSKAQVGLSNVADVAALPLIGGTLTGVATLNLTNLGTTSADGIVLGNTTAATSTTTVQVSPRLRLRGSAWKSSATAASQTQDWAVDVLPATGVTSATSRLRFGYSNNGGVYSFPMVLTNTGFLGINTTAPTSALHVNGNGNVVGTLSVGTSLSSQTINAYEIHIEDNFYCWDNNDANYVFSACGSAGDEPGFNVYYDTHLYNSLKLDGDAVQANKKTWSGKFTTGVEVGLLQVWDNNWCYFGPYSDPWGGSGGTIVQLRYGRGNDAGNAIVIDGPNQTFNAQSLRSNWSSGFFGGTGGVGGIYAGKEQELNFYPGLWFGSAAAAPTTSNYAFLNDGNGNIVNTPSGSYLMLRVNNDYSNGVVLTADKNLVVGGAYNSTANAKLDVRGTVYLQNTTAPATPSGGGVLWVEGGALKYKGSSGNVTVLGNA